MPATSTKKHTINDLDQISHIDSDATVTAATARYKQLETALKDVAKSLAASRPAPVSDPVKYGDDGTADVNFLLNGGNVEDIGGPTTADARDTLIRRKIALEKAIPVALTRIIAAQNAAGRRACEALEPLARQIMGQLFDAYENLARCVAAWEAFLGACQSRGIRQNSRPAEWACGRWEAAVKNGAERIGPLEAYLESRRKVWNLSGPTDNLTNGRKKVL